VIQERIPYCLKALALEKCFYNVTSAKTWILTFFTKKSTSKNYLVMDELA